MFCITWAVRSLPHRLPPVSASAEQTAEEAMAVLDESGTHAICR